MIPAVVALLVFLGVLALSIAVSALRDRRSTIIQQRLADHELTLDLPGIPRLERIQVLREKRKGPSPRLGKLGRRLQPGEKTEQLLLQADSSMSVGRLVLVRVLVGAVGFLVLYAFLRNPIVGLLGGIVASFLPMMLLRRKVNQRRQAFERQLAEALDLMVGSLRAGQGLMQALESTAQEAKDPLSRELRLVIEQVNIGANTTDAMESLAQRVRSSDVDLFVSAILINRQTGGNLTEVLENLAKTVRERRDVREEAKSLTSGPRLTAYILIAIPLGLAAYSLALSPVYREQLIGTSLGRIMLVSAVVWTLIGFFLAMRIARVEY